MDNAELIAALRSHQMGSLPYITRRLLQTIESQERQIANLQEACAELEAQLPKWISIKDRLPTEKGAYLTAYYDGFVCENEWHFIGETAVGWVNDGEAVRYWMKLPEPPNCGAMNRGEPI